MYIDNKYTRWYSRIISRAQNRELISDHIELHHIIPRSLGGSNSKSNIVALTLKEHYICHLLLVKMTTGDDRKKMALALCGMSRTRSGLKLKARTFETFRAESAQYLSEKLSGRKIGPHSVEHKQKIREATIKRYEDPLQRKKSGDHTRGKKATEEQRAKYREGWKKKIESGYSPKPNRGMRGKKHSPETKERMRLAWERRRAQQQ